MIGLDDVLEAEDRISGGIRPTALVRSDALSAAAGADVLLKNESEQRTGSFKVRGALNALAAAPAGERAGGVVTASAGNHGLGVALAARELGVRATVFVPSTAPEIKREGIAALGADLRTVGGDYDAAHREAEVFAAESGAVYVHAFSDPLVVAGQGTVGLEIARSCPGARMLVVPVGGGGLVGGIGVVARALLPHARVVGVQSVHTSAMHASLRAGEPRPGTIGPTVCDGLAGEIDAHSLALAAEVVDEVILVEESSIRSAVRRLHREEGITAEGSAAVAAAAIWEGLLPPASGPVVAVITGGNIDPALLSQILSE